MRGFSPILWTLWSSHYEKLESHVRESWGRLGWAGLGLAHTGPEATATAPSGYTRGSRKPPQLGSRPLGSRQIKAQVTNAPTKRVESKGKDETEYKSLLIFDRKWCSLQSYEVSTMIILAGGQVTPRTAYQQMKAFLIWHTLTFSRIYQQMFFCCILGGLTKAKYQNITN